MNIQKQILHLDLRPFLGGFWRENSNETCVTSFQTMWFPNVSKCTKMYQNVQVLQNTIYERLRD